LALEVLVQALLMPQPMGLMEPILLLMELLPLEVVELVHIIVMGLRVAQEVAGVEEIAALLILAALEIHQILLQAKVITVATDKVQIAILTILEAAAVPLR
jgi:hypothetical protein